MFNVNGRRDSGYTDMPFPLPQPDGASIPMAGAPPQPHPETLDMMMRTDGQPPLPAASAQVPGATADFTFNNPWFQNAGPSARPPPPAAIPGSAPGAAVPPVAAPGAFPHMFPGVVGGQPQQSPTPPAAEAGAKKKKRRADGESPGVEEKRTKTGRACDACRSKKIRCDILPADPAAGGDSGQPICAHCKQYNIECTFFLPITETRFKKRRPTTDETASPNATKTDSHPNGTPAAAGPVSGSKASGGPASIPFLLHSSMPPRSFEQFDLNTHAHWEVSEDAEGRIVVEATDDSDGDGTRSARLEKHVLSSNIMSSLINGFFQSDYQFVPIVSRAEFLASRNPPPLLLYAMAVVAGTRRDYTRHVFNRIRSVVNNIFRSNEVLSHPTFQNVQALMLMAVNGEIHSQPTAPTADAAIMRIGAGVRMAQYLGLHRENKTKPQTIAELEQVELRRRLWSVAVFLDVWYTCALGTPPIINIEDCDVLLPSPFRIVPNVPSSEWPIEPAFLFSGENLKLSILLNRILKAVYGPTGLTHATDELLEKIVTDLRAWKEGLPELLKFKGNNSSWLAGLLHMLYCAVKFLFWRGFLRVTHAPPPHLKFVLDGKSWGDLVNGSREAIEWLNNNDRVLDTHFTFPYSATSCALVQYHNWARRRDPASLETLKLVRDVVQRWEAALQPDQMSIRRKSCETMTLLYEAALKTNPDNDDRTDRSEGTPSSAISGISARVGGSASASNTNANSAHAPAFPHRRQPNLSVDRGDGPQNVEYYHAPDAVVNVFDNAGNFDVSFLDSLPDSNFDWSGWGQYFETVDRMFPAAAGESGTASPRT